MEWNQVLKTPPCQSPTWETPRDLWTPPTPAGPPTPRPAIGSSRSRMTTGMPVFLRNAAMLKGKLNKVTERDISTGKSWLYSDEKFEEDELSPFLEEDAFVNPLAAQQRMNTFGRKLQELKGLSN